MKDKRAEKGRNRREWLSWKDERNTGESKSSYHGKIEI